MLLARCWYHLPYRWAKMRVTKRGNTVEYQSDRKSMFGKGRTDIAIEIDQALETANFDHFLTARFRLYTAAAGRVAFAQIEHQPWPLHNARVVRLHETLIENSGVPRPKANQSSITRKNCGSRQSFCNGQNEIFLQRHTS